MLLMLEWFATRLIHGSVTVPIRLLLVVFVILYIYKVSLARTTVLHCWTCSEIVYRLYSFVKVVILTFR